jgi:hypothetical protein
VYNLLVTKYGTNILFFFHAVGNPISLAFPATRKIKRAQRVRFLQRFKNIATFQSIRAVAMHEDNADFRLGYSLEEGDMKFFVVMVVDGQNLMRNIDVGK